MKQSKISFIIPALNEAKIIRSTIDGLKAYSGPKEIIVSDGGSRDGTPSIARNAGAVVTEHRDAERQTIAAGRNAGAKLANGDFFVFVDADVTISDIDNFFAKAFQNFENDNKLVALTCGYKILPEKATLADKIIFKILSLNFVIFNNFFHVGLSGGEFQMIRSEAFQKLHGFNQSLVAAEDGDMFSRLGKIGRTKCDISLSIYHSGRREHAIGWPRLIYQWMRNYLTVQFFRRSWSKEWTEVR